MNIYITENNKGRLQNVLDEVQKRSRTRNISLEDLFDIMDLLNNKFSIIPKKYMEGIKISVDYNAQKFPNSYYLHSYKAPVSTIIELERSHNKWALTACYRGVCRTPNSMYMAEIPEEAKKKIIESYAYFHD